MGFASLATFLGGRIRMKPMTICWGRHGGHIASFWDEVGSLVTTAMCLLMEIGHDPWEAMYLVLEGIRSFQGLGEIYLNSFWYSSFSCVKVGIASMVVWQLSCHCLLLVTSWESYSIQDSKSHSDLAYKIMEIISQENACLQFWCVATNCFSSMWLYLSASWGKLRNPHRGGRGASPERLVPSGWLLWGRRLAVCRRCLLGSFQCSGGANLRELTPPACPEEGF